MQRHFVPGSLRLFRSISRTSLPSEGQYESISTVAFYFRWYGLRLRYPPCAMRPKTKTVPNAVPKSGIEGCPPWAKDASFRIPYQGHKAPKSSSLPSVFPHTEPICYAMDSSGVIVHPPSLFRCEERQRHRHLPPTQGTAETARRGLTLPHPPNCPTVPTCFRASKDSVDRRKRKTVLVMAPGSCSRGRNLLEPPMTTHWTLQ